MKRYAGNANEGIEVGVTTMPPERASATHNDYAATAAFPSWFSSDSGSLWIDGRPHYDAGQWKHTRPVSLTAGDVVTITVTAAGALEVHCNGVWQVRVPAMSM